MKRWLLLFLLVPAIAYAHDPYGAASWRRLSSLVSCSASEDKLLWNSTTGRFSCGTDQAGGGVSDGDKGDITVSGTGATWSVDSGAVAFGELSGSATDGQIPNNITIDLAATATTANAGDSATAFFSTGTIEEARLPTTLATESEVASAYQPLATDLTRLVDNCVLENDSTPIPDSCVGDGSDAGGGGGWTFFTFGSTSTNSTTTPTTITGFTIPVTTSDNIRAKCSVITDAAAATTGVQITFAGPTATRATLERVSCSSTTAIVSASFNGFSADNRTASGGTTRCTEEWDINIFGASNGTDVTAQVDSEIATSAVNVFEESYCQWMTY